MHSFCIALCWLLCICSRFIGTCHCQFEQTTYNVNGQALYTSTPGAPVETVTTAVASRPTLIYNCAWMPAICKNVRSARNDPTFSSGSYVYDKDVKTGGSAVKGRKNQRRKSVCPKNWKTDHLCPEPQQPSVIAARRGPANPGPTDLADDQRDRSSAGAYEIEAPMPLTNAVNQPSSGLQYSCDEHPPAIFIEGGSGISGNDPAETYCAPITYCKSGNPRSTASEQNWQAAAHSMLGNLVSRKNGLYTISFALVTEPESPWAAYVDWTDDYNAGFSRAVNPGRRDVHLKARDNDFPVTENVTLMSAVHGDNNTINHFVVHGSGGSRSLQPIKESKLAQFNTVNNVDHVYTSQSSMTNNSQPSVVSATPEFIRNSPVQQNFANGSAPVPIQQLSLMYLLGQTDINSTFDGNMTSWTNSSLLRNNRAPPLRVRDLRALESLNPFMDHTKRSTVVTQCDLGQPCADGSCCSMNKTCGYGPEHCGVGNCTSNCNSQAMCGRDSAGANASCGLNLCCSYYGWCGTEEVHCINSDPIHKTTPCQQGFGGCQIVQAPVCDQGRASASKGRKIAYYQASNVRSRACNRIDIPHIKTDGLSHLIFAFALIDPVSFKITPSNSLDVDLYRQFTKLKGDKLQTWIAVGGFDFSDPGPTRTTWSDMTASATSRTTFINSLTDFMDQYGFDGVDLDWEYPTADSRGGKPADTQNLVSLVREMRKAFGSRGISMTLAPDYWYLRGFDPKAMQDSVDFFGFMAYDLHGSWDSETKTLGSIVRPQTDIRDIDQDLLPLWFAGLDPAKVNFGLAYYGRGFTVKDRACPYVGCPFAGPSKAGPCTNFPGVMSLREIEAIINSTGSQPRLIPNAMVKELIFNQDQWIGFDDEETIALKMAYADKACLGGTMIWSVDFASGEGSGDTPDSADNMTSAHFGPVVYSADGSCGPTNNNTFCSSNSAAYNGTCCSSSGYCGSGPMYCATGCLSGCDGKEVSQYLNGNASVGDDIFIDPSIWKEDSPDVSCNSPCRLIFPPWPLSSPSILTIDSLTASWTVTQTLTSTGIQDGQTISASSVTKYLTTTQVAQSPVTLASLNISAITISSGQSVDTSYELQPSITPSPVTVTYSVPSLSLDTSSSVSPSSSSGLAVAVFKGSAPEGQRVHVIYPASIKSSKLPPLPHVHWHLGPLKIPCLINCGHPPPAVEHDDKSCSGDDCGGSDNVDNKPCLDNTCLAGDDAISGSDDPTNDQNEENDEEEEEEEDDDEDESCALQPVVEDIPDDSPLASSMGFLGSASPSVPAAKPSMPSANSIVTATLPSSSTDLMQEPSLTMPSVNSIGMANSPSSTADETQNPSPSAKPLIQGPYVCNAYSKSYSKCWTDIDASDVNGTRQQVTDSIPNSPMNSTSANWTLTVINFDGSTLAPGESPPPRLFFNIGWIPGCSIVDSEAPDLPFGKGGKNAFELLTSNYFKCTGNSGLGGYTDVGCLRYGFFPNFISGATFHGWDPSFYWAANGNVCG